jgi:hypothetical protein
MSDKCINNLTIRGNEQLIKKALNAIQDSAGCVDFSVSVTPSYDADTQWYNDNWGTVKNVNKSESLLRERAIGSCSIEFITIYSPPDIWLRTVSQLFPELVFTIAYSTVNIFYTDDSEITGKEYYGLLLSTLNIYTDQTWDPNLNENNNWYGDNKYRQFMSDYFPNSYIQY